MRIGLSHALQRGNFRLGCFDDFLDVRFLPCAAMSTSHGPGERGSSSLRTVCDRKGAVDSGGVTRVFKGA
jgi:hypothetical protein